MKKLLLASAVAVLSITAVHAAPTVYGKAFLTLDVQDGNDAAKEGDGVETRTQLNSNTSRIGFKGSEKLTKEIDLLYQLEYGIDIDAKTNYDDEGNAKNQFYARDTYLGLSHKRFGTAVAGRLTTIDDYVNYANVTKGGVIGGDNVLASFDGPRANNAFAYFSPTFNGLQFMAMYALDEKKDGGLGDGRDGFGVGVKYEPNGAPYMGGLSYIQAAGDFRAARLSGAYALNPQITLGALYQNTQFGKDSKKENAFTVSGKYKIAQTPWTTYAQADFVDNFDGTDAERSRLAVGGEYSFNKATTGHLYGAYLQDKATGFATEKAYGVGAGLEYKF
ncbi:porin [Moraxella oblonga]|uniref:porin n=1 Tax=Moraxella oblonga TaxID=200413 RepID=UPI0008346607|nr:porin [Moraxella oblonga]